MSDDELDYVDENGLRLTEIVRFDDDEDGVIFHVKFSFRLLDETLDAFDVINLEMQLRGADLDNLTINEIKKRALTRAIKVAQSLSEHIAEQAG